MGDDINNNAFLSFEWGLCPKYAHTYKDKYALAQSETNDFPSKIYRQRRGNYFSPFLIGIVFYIQNLFPESQEIIRKLVFLRN